MRIGAQAGPSTLLLFITLWPLGPSGDPQLYYYLLHFGNFGVWATSLGAAVGSDWGP